MKFESFTKNCAADAGRAPEVLPGIDKAVFRRAAAVVNLRSDSKKKPKCMNNMVSLPSLLDSPGPCQQIASGRLPLSRPPRWSTGTAFDDYDISSPKHKELVHLAKKKQLRTLFREERQTTDRTSRSSSLCRQLVERVKANDDSWHWRADLQHKQEAEKSVQRIEGHMRGCSNARHELMQMQKKLNKMCTLPPAIPSDISTNLRQVFASALGRRSAAEDDVSSSIVVEDLS